MNNFNYYSEIIVGLSKKSKKIDYDKLLALLENERIKQARESSFTFKTIKAGTILEKHTVDKRNKKYIGKDCQWLFKNIDEKIKINKINSENIYIACVKTNDEQIKNENDWKEAGYRHVPNGVVRKGSYIAKNAVLMPCFVNLGAYVDEGTMIDTWASVGSCAQVGKNCHISGGAGIGGVLEPLQADPVIIEDNCFVGARSEIAEGVLVEEGAVISMGVYIGASTKIVDRSTGEISYGKVPAYSVVVPGSLPNKKNPDGPSLYCAVIVKQVDEKTRSKTSINDLLRD